MRQKFRKISLFLLAAMLIAFYIPFSASAAEGERPSLTIGRLNTPPTIDGVMNPSEWGDKSFTLAEGQPNVTVHHKTEDDGNGNTVDLPVKPTETDVYLGYDDTHVYLGVVATYADHQAMALLGSQLWQEDCIQTKISANESVYNDIDFGFNATTNRALSYTWNGHGVTAEELEAGKGRDFMITRSGNTTTYEIAYPLSSFATTVLRLREGSNIFFSIAQCMSGGGWYEYAGGIVLDKDISNTAILTLGPAKNLGNTGGGSGGNTSSQTTSGGNTGSTATGGSSSNTSGTSSQSSDISGGGADNSSDNVSGNASGSDTGNSSDTDTTESDATNAGNDSSEKEGGSSYVWIIVVIIVAALAVLGVAFYFLILRKRPE